MNLQTILSRRLLLGTGLLSILALAGGVTTLATTQTQAQSPVDATCAQQDLEPDGAEVKGPDTDNVELECGDQNESNDGPEASEPAGETDDDGAQTTVPVPGTTSP